MLLTFENLSHILRLEPASQPQNLRAEPQQLERVTPGSNDDDTQVYDRCHPNDATSLCRELGGCIEHVASWMSANRRQLNAAKTEFLWLVPPRRRHQLPPDHLVVSPVQVAPVASATGAVIVIVIVIGGVMSLSR